MPEGLTKQKNMLNYGQFLLGEVCSVTICEFKAWLEGFEEAIGDKAPTKPQWKRIKERLAEVNDVYAEWPYRWPSGYVSNTPFPSPFTVTTTADPTTTWTNSVTSDDLFTIYSSESKQLS